MKNIYLFLLTLTILSLSSCTNFLDVKPDGVLSDGDVSTPDQIDNQVISAYAMLGNDHYTAPFDLWPYGNVRSDDAYKGGRDESDIAEYNFYETSQNILPSFGEADEIWYHCYIAIGRANTALRLLNGMSDAQYPQRKERMAECRFLRGHFYFILKIMYKNIPYIDENVAIADYGTVSNVALSNDESWGKIAEDFQYAYDNLPNQQTEIGRANKYAAAAYLAKTYLYKAYRQDAQHNVTGIDATDLNQVLTFTNAVISGSAYSLAPDFADNFLPGKGTYENGVESIFAIQYSKDDGTAKGRLNFGDVLNVPLNTSGACDFHKPSQNLVNAFKTVNGLPDFNSFNVVDYNENTDKVDPRLYHTVAMVGYPYKYDYTMYTESCSRNPTVYGYYSSLKENVNPNDPSSVLMDPFRANTKNKIILRFADVLLMRAEALVELNREKEALPLINQLRQRAQNSLTLIPYARNTNISLYNDGVNCNWTNDYARTAVRFERRLELAMEGNRFFDLVRWGIADQVLNAYYDGEKSKRAYYGTAHFTKNKNEYIPIPQNQINFSKNVYKQNCNF